MRNQGIATCAACLLRSRVVTTCCSFHIEMYRAYAHKSAGGGRFGKFWSAEKWQTADSKLAAPLEAEDKRKESISWQNMRDGGVRVPVIDTATQPLSPCVPCLTLLCQCNAQKMSSVWTSSERCAFDLASASAAKSKSRERGQRPREDLQRRPAGESRCCRATTAKLTESAIDNVFMTSNR